MDAVRLLAHLDDPVGRVLVRREVQVRQLGDGVAEAIVLATLSDVATADVGDRDAHHIAGNCRTENFMAGPLQEYHICEAFSLFPRPPQTDPNRSPFHRSYWQPPPFRQSQQA